MLLLLALGCLGPLAAEDEPPARAAVELASLARDVPRVRVVRTEVPPEIDGRLDEPVWQDAAVIPNLTQVEPIEGVPPERPTEVRLLYDQDFLYLGVRAYDPEPERIIATEMRRDDLFRADDRIEFVLDTFLDRRNGFRFRVNPLGARGDGLIEAGRDIGDEWDGIWYADTSIDEQGWVAEIAIPFKTVGFDANQTAWGFNIERVVRRDNETSRWAAARQGRDISDLPEAGIIEGLIGIETGLGLDIRPNVTVRHRRDEREDSRSTRTSPSLDAFFRLTPSLTASGTINTDFAETEVDEREINLDRFELFFPEKRDFFLQDAGIFEFGRIQRNGRPFFSRRIGLDDEGEEVGILAGGKLTGRLGPVSLGLLDVFTEEKGELDAKNLFVGRGTVNVLEESTVGMIVTHGNPIGDEDNAVVGADAFLRTGRLFGQQVGSATLWLQHSFTEDRSGRAFAYGTLLEYPNEPVELSLGFTEIQEDFRPALGFVNRRGIRQYETSGRYRHRFPPRQWIRKIDTGAGVELITDDRDNALETAELRVDLFKIENDPGDGLNLTYRFTHEDLDEDFRLAGRVPVPAGTFNFHRGTISIETSDARPLSGGLELGYGGFFNGTRLEIKPTVELRLAPYLRLGAEYEENQIRTPTGDLDARLLRARVVLQFSPDLAWTTLAQYDNLSESIGINSRVRWTIEPGNDLFLVFNNAFGELDDRSLRSTDTEVAAKLGWTFRF